MNYVQCYAVLGLAPGATLRQIHRAYKRQALAHHPDRTAGDSDHLARFCQITEAYTTLKSAFHMSKLSRRVGLCARCEQVAELFRGADRRRYCAACLLPGKRRLLPMPKLETIRCAAAIGLQVGALYCVVASFVFKSWQHGIYGLLLALAALAALAYSVLVADVIET